VKEQRRAQRAPLWIGQAIEELIPKALKQIADPRERQRPVRLARRRYQHPVAEDPSTLRRVAPNGRLPDPRSALERDPDRSARRAGEQLLDPSALRFASEQLAQALPTNRGIDSRFTCRVISHSVSRTSPSKRAARSTRPGAAETSALSVSEKCPGS